VATDRAATGESPPGPCSPVTALLRRRELRREGLLPLRLLALVAVILGPTDVALGRRAVSDRRVPVLVRHGLDIESGVLRTPAEPADAVPPPMCL